MPVKPYKSQVWKVPYTRVDGAWEGRLVALWELEYDPMSDDYSPDEISAVDLFSIWAKEVRVHYPDQYVPISWYIESPGKAKFEAAPFQEPTKLIRSKDFLSAYGWPVAVATGERVNWMRVPVVDKQWNKTQSVKGGFIQEATGWKPSMLQPSVYLPALEAAAYLR